MNDFVFQNTTKVYFGKDQLKSLSAELKPLNAQDVEAIFRMCL